MYIHIICIYIYVVYVCGSNFFLLHWSESFQYSHLPTLFSYISDILLILSLYYIIQIYQKYCPFFSDHSLTHSHTRTHKHTRTRTHMYRMARSPSTTPRRSRIKRRGRQCSQSWRTSL